MTSYVMQSIGWSLVGLLAGIPLGQMLERAQERRDRAPRR